jgi:hypothetical protein
MKSEEKKVWVYMHPEGSGFLFAPAILQGDCEFIEVYGFTDDELNERFAHEFNSEGWAEGRDVTRWVLDRLNEALQGRRA